MGFSSLAVVGRLFSGCSTPIADTGGGDGSCVIEEEPEDEDETQPRDSVRPPLPPLKLFSVAAAITRATGILAYCLVESIKQARWKCCCCCWARRTRRREGSIARLKVKSVVVEERNLAFRGTR